MAEAIEPWGASHPEEWALRHELAMAGEGDPRVDEIQLVMVSDSGVKSRKRAGLLEVVDLLEAALRGGASSSGASEHR
jgi:hypothetical protein